jgi:hypothetical protein
MPVPKARKISKQEAVLSSISLLVLSNRKPLDSASKVMLEKLKLAVIASLKNSGVFVSST